jgi:dTDP-glucose pyrophosphorylase
VGDPPPRPFGVAALSEGREEFDRVREKPTKPDTFPFATFADAVHAVVPITRADERQSVFASEFHALVKSARAMLE